MKKMMASILLVTCMLGLAICKHQQTQEGNQSNQSGASLASFSFEEDCSIYIEGDPSVKADDFLNVDTCPIDNQTAAVERAKNECTIEYNATSAYYDRLTDIWRIDFFTLNRNEQGQFAVASGNCQSVYLNSDGVIQFIVYGE